MEHTMNQKISAVFNPRRLSVVVFSLFFSWLLAIPFEGRVLYALADYYNVSVKSFVFGTMAAHFVGLITCGIFVRHMKIAKKLMLFSIVFCFASSTVFFSPPSFLWTVVLLLAAFLLGSCVAAFLLALRLPKEEVVKTSYSGHGENYASKAGALAFLCLFIVVITINSGLMYRVQGPAFSHLEWLTSWYWAVPYIGALFIMRNLPRKTNRAYILYVAIAMIGFSFIAFLLLGRSWVDYLVVNTLMLGACGVYDLFLWSILGEMLDFDNNPAKIMGIGLSANVLGVLLGGLIGSFIQNGQSYYPTLLALGMVCITLILLPPLHMRLLSLLKNHAYLTTITEIPVQDQSRLIGEFAIREKFTEREAEIATLLIKGKTYRMIAGQLHVSENTVKTHVKNIYSKAGVQNRTELMNLLLDIHIS